jgi:hypothetical protein
MVIIGVVLAWMVRGPYVAFCDIVALGDGISSVAVRVANMRWF